MRALRHGLLTLAFLAAALPDGARAQTSDGFFFQSPRWTVSLRTGLAVPRAQSDVFAFTSEQLTVDRGDFTSLSLGGDVAMRVFGWTHLVLSVDGANKSHRSEFRDYVDNEELPIEQSTKFSRVTFSLGVKQYLTSPGRSIGRLAWVPARIAPFLGGGVGAMRYDFHQYGDFIDFQDMDVFTAQFRSTGWTSTVHARGGVDYTLSPRVALTLQGRYDWSDGATLSRDFTGFDKIDLTALSVSGGLTIRF